MLMIYKNLFDFGTAVATSEDPNYPVTNLDYSEFQGRTYLAPFKAESNISTITLTLDTEDMISGFGIANHNIDSLTIELYDGLSSLLYTNTYSYADLVTPYGTIELISFAEVNGVTSIKFIMEGITDPVYVGSLMVGLVTELPPATFLDVNSPISQTGVAGITPEGAIFGEAGIRLEGHAFRFLKVTQSEIDYLSDAAEYSRLNKPFFLKRYENDKLKVYWCRYTNTVLDQDIGLGPVYNTGFAIQEVR